MRIKGAMVMTVVAVVFVIVVLGVIVFVIVVLGVIVFVIVVLGVIVFVIVVLVVIVFMIVVLIVSVFVIVVLVFIGDRLDPFGGHNAQAVKSRRVDQSCYPALKIKTVHKQHTRLLYTARVRRCWAIDMGIAVASNQRF